MDDNDHANPSNMPDEAPDSKSSSASLLPTTTAAEQGGPLEGAEQQRQLGDKPKISILNKLASYPQARPVPMLMMRY